MSKCIFSIYKSCCTTSSSFIKTHRFFTTSKLLFLFSRKNQIAFYYFQDGRICRVSFRVQADKIESNPTETTKPKPKHLTPQTTRPQSRQSIHRLNNFDRPSFENLILSSSNPSIAAAANINGQVDILPQLQAGYPLSRQRHHLIRTARGRAGIIFGSRPLIPPSSVPEELIEQVRSIEHTFVSTNSMSRLTEFHHRDPRHLASSRAIAHAYATSSGLAWSACFSFSLFGRQRLR